MSLYFKVLNISQYFNYVFSCLRETHKDFHLWAYSFLAVLLLCFLLFMCCSKVISKAVHRGCLLILTKDVFNSLCGHDFRQI